MAEQYIEIKHKNKSGEEKTIPYRIDADFVPSKLDEICEEFIQNYCLAKGQEEWLDKQYNSKEEFTVKAEGGKTVGGKKYKQGEKYIAEKSFISIRRDFGKEFFGIEKKEEEPKVKGRDKWKAKKEAKAK